MKKKIIIIAIAFVLFILLFPIRLVLKDGGTVEYKAVLYTVTKRHSLSEKQTADGYYYGFDIGTEVEILGFEVYNDVEFVPDEFVPLVSDGTGE